MKLNDNKNIFCSVSSGYSSVMMAIKLREWYPDHNIINVMANTSKERIESLEFMDRCDKYYNLNLVWIEAIINQEKNKGTDFKITSYKDLKVDGEIMEEGIKKYGIPSKVNKWCTRELKLVPLIKYADSIFRKDSYSVAVGLRADEFDRVRKDFKTNNVFYPLMDYKVKSKDRNRFWSKQPIKLNIKAYENNCDYCFQKSNRKLMTMIVEENESKKNEEEKRYDWWQRMIDEYGAIPKPTSKSYNDLQKQNGGQMTFYRGYNTIEDLVEMAKQPFRKANDEYIYENDLFDQEDECGSGCQVF